MFTAIMISYVGGLAAVPKRPVYVCLVRLFDVPSDNADELNLPCFAAPLRGAEHFEASSPLM